MADGSNRNRASDNGRVVYLIHGLRQSPGAFKPLADLLSALGHRPVAISYDWQRPFADCAAEVADALQHGDNGIAIGHSTGADALRYAAVRGWLPWLQGAIFACPCINGKKAGLLSRCLFSTAEFYCDQTRKESADILPTLAGKPPMDHVTIAALHDRFIPLESALDMHGMNVIVAGGHMDGTGCGKRFNAVYCACVNYLCDHDSLTKI
jgi:pimeloyl-ACP methyl ester carboxylesterase